MARPSKYSVSVGSVFYEWTVLAEVKHHIYLVKCSCGREQEISRGNLCSPSHSFMCKPCGHIKSATTQQTPMASQYGDYKVIAQQGRVGKELGYLCRCKCGIENIVAKNNLVSGKSKCCRSCGLKTHGMSGTPLHQNWKNMVSRAKGYKSTIQKDTCVVYKDLEHDKEWLYSFEAFRADMEDEWFEGSQLHRKDNTMGYKYSNCVWLSKSDHKVAHHIEDKGGKVQW